LGFALAGLCWCLTASGGPRPNELDRLGSELTPVGALRAGNLEGTVPAWSGGLTSPPEGYQAGETHLDPFGAETPVMVIDAGNAAAFEIRLSPGHQSMLRNYPDTYALTIYPSHRTAAYPERIYEMTARNGATGTLTAAGEGVTGVAEGFPFPFPDNAREIIWNHKLRFRGTGGQRALDLAAVTAGGDFQPVRLTIETLSLYHQTGATLESTENRLLYLLQTIDSPARLAGTLLLVHESLNQAAQPRSAWTYNPSQRRVIRAPNVAYDNPANAADGLVVSDMADMFNGAMDRFDWSLEGKRELYVPYNAYRLHGADPGFDAIVQAGHLDPQALRYELHRVWVVEARLREGFRHIHPRRTYYLDEDSYQVLLAEHYDHQGRLWRFSEAHPVVFYEVPMLWTTLESHHDLQTRRFVSYRLNNERGTARFDLEISPREFSPQALRRKGRR